MPVLRERIRWQLKPTRPNRSNGGLSNKEQANVRRALRYQRELMGTSYDIAKALGVSRTLVTKIATRQTVTANVAVRLAKLVGVEVDDLLAGKWPVPRICPLCGKAE